MNKLTLLIAVLLPCMAQGATYTLPDLVRSAEATSKELKASDEEIKKAEAFVREAMGKAAPSIDASANYQYAFKNFNPISGMLGGSAIPDSVTFFDSSSMSLRTVPTALSPNIAYYRAMGRADAGDSLIAARVDMIQSMFGSMDFSYPPQTLALTLSLKQPLFAQGKVTTGLKIARAYLSGLQSKRDGIRQKIIANISKLFYSALLARKNLAIQSEAVKLSAETHRLSVVRMLLGKGSELDTLASRLSFEKARIDSQSAASQYRMACEALIKQAGVFDAAEAFEIQGEFPQELPNIALDEALAKARNANPNAKQLETGSVVQKHLIDIAKSDFFPIVYCGGSLGKIYMFDKLGEIDWSNESNSDYKVFIGASINLTSGFTRLQKVRQAQADRRSFEQSKALAYDGIDLGVKNAWEQLQTARKQLESTQLLEMLAQKGYEIAKKSYEIGALTLIDMQKRELDLQSAHLARNAALFSCHAAKIDLKVLMGEIEY